MPYFPYLCSVKFDKIKVMLQTTKQTLEQDLVELQPNMLNFAMSLTANKEEAKDLAQETTLKTLTNIDKYYDDTNFKGWIFTIMRNIFVNNYRRAVRSQTVIDQTDNLYLLNASQDSGFNSPEGAYSYSEIHKVLNSFSDEYKEPFSMHFLGYKYEEIAQKLNLPLGTVKSRIFFTRKRLQEILKDYR